MKQSAKNKIKLFGIFIPGILFLFIFLNFGCKTSSSKSTSVNNPSAEQILGDSTFLALSYGGYRTATRDQQPTLAELTEDLKILSAMGVKLLRTYNATKPHAANLLKAIRQLRSSDEYFEMYLMLGAWIDCENAWTDKTPNHQKESKKNAGEIARAVALAQEYPEIVKIIAVGNEAMVKWAVAYYVEPDIILKWVNHLQDLKTQGVLSKDLWITSSDNFASWGGGSEEYWVDDLNQLISAVDFISMHTYPMHDTHYNPDFWHAQSDNVLSNKKEIIDEAMERSIAYAKAQYESVKNYMDSIGINKPIHIGETGWASSSDGFYGSEGSRACDEYKQARYYNQIRNWTNRENISCFYFEAFDEPWKDAGNPNGSENHFGLLKVDGSAKYVMWNLVDEGKFNGLSRGGQSIQKTFKGSLDSLMNTILIPSLEETI